MYNAEKDKKFVEGILGSPLPEIDPIYYEGAKIWKDVDKRPFITPYLLSKVFTVDQMKIVMALPGSPKQAAEKTGFDEKYCEEQLAYLFEWGRVSPGKRYHLETRDTYTPVYNLVTQRDLLAAAYNSHNRDWNDNKEMFLLANEWCVAGDDINPEEFNTGFKGSRIIPKWNSIKNIPGVLPEENFKEIMYENFKNGTLAWQKCVCKTYRNFERYGTPVLPDGGGCESGIKEIDKEHGHCLAFGQRGRYMAEVFGYKPKTIEEVDRCIDECEDAVVMYMAKNMYEVGNICTCCGDCCPIYYRDFTRGIDLYQASRFRPEVSVDKCVGCKTCLARCLFNAITFDANGKCVVDPDKCKGCGNCVIKCPTKALKMVTVHDTDWIPDIEDYIK